MTITSKNQVTFPKSLLDYMGVDKGDKIFVKVEKERVVLEPLKGSFVDLQGILLNTPAAKKHNLGEIIKIAGKREAKRIALEGLK